MTVAEGRRIGPTLADGHAAPPGPAQRNGGAGPTAAGAPDLARAIVETVAYADVFDWPLTPVEIHRFLPLPARLDEVVAALATSAGPTDLESLDGLIMLRGRGSLVESRRRRAAASARMWPGALRAARAVASLPFVRLVAVTGSLAVDAAEPGADVDLFVVTEDKRLWLTRAAVIGVVRAAGLRGLRLCPNYFLSEFSLEIHERDRFTAHDLAQMVPVSGAATYRELLSRNGWYREFLPNHQPSTVALTGRPGRPRSLVESALRGRAFHRVERWEMRRKVARLAAGKTSGEQRFDAMACKGHFEEHRRRALAAFEARLAALELAP